MQFISISANIILVSNHTYSFNCIVASVTPLTGPEPQPPPKQEVIVTLSIIFQQLLSDSKVISFGIRTQKQYVITVIHTLRYDIIAYFDTFCYFVEIQSLLTLLSNKTITVVRLDIKDILPQL